jgi:hypothetical protein
MSLLDWGCTEDVVVYPEITDKDADGNTQTKPSDTGIPVKARVQVLGQSGTASRRQEQDNEGYESEKVYTIRFPRSFTQILGAQSEIVWKGKRWALFGDANFYTSSPRTAHQTYTIKRY